jgi:hypothetical protein
VDLITPFPHGRHRYGPREHRRNGIVVRPKSCEKGEKNETDCAYGRDHGCHGRDCGMRNNAQDADLPGRVDCRGGRALPAASTAAASAPTADGELSGRIDGPGRRDLSDSATASAAASGAQVRRARLNLHGRRFCAGRTFQGPHAFKWRLVLRRMVPFTTP